MKAAILAIILAIAIPAHAQIVKSESPIVKCSTHSRQLHNPLTWLDSDICEADYKKFRDERMESGVWQRPAWKDKQFWAGTSIIGGSFALDAWSTSRVVDLPGHETNWLLPGHPTNGQIAAWAAGSFALNVGLHYVEYRLSHNDPAKGWRVFGRWALPAINAGMHGYGAAHNLSQ